MSLMTIFGKMVVILFGVAAGFAANRLGYFTKETDRSLSRLILNITMPAMILATVMTGDELPPTETILSGLGVSAIFYGLGIAFMLVMPRLLGGTAGEKGVWGFSFLFPNLAFIGYPVITALLGKEALLFAVILVLPSNLLNYMVGPSLLGGGKFNWKSLLTPAVISAVISLAIALFRIETPALLREMLDLVGSSTVPLSLMVLGSLLSGMQAKDVFSNPRMWVVAVIRLAVMPLIILLILRPMNLNELVLGVAVLETAMPVALNGTMLSMEYGGDTDCMARTIFLTTIFSMVTIPLVAMLL